MLRKVTHCAGRVSANTRPHQLRWGGWEMGTAISCTKCSQVAGLIQKLVETPRTSKAPSLRPAVLRAAVFRSKIYVYAYVCTCTCMNICIYYRESLAAKLQQHLNIGQTVLGPLVSCNRYVHVFNIYMHTTQIVQ